jgi:hypothetical protein
MALKVYACVDYDTTTETCAAHAYIDPPMVLPALSVADGQAVGLKLLGCFVAIKVVMYLRETITDRIGS